MPNTDCEITFVAHEAWWVRPALRMIYNVWPLDVKHLCVKLSTRDKLAKWIVERGVTLERVK